MSDALNRAIQQALSLHQQGQVDRAISAYQDILRTVPTAAPVQHFLGLALLQKDDNAGAARTLETAIQLDEGNPDFRLHHVQALQKLGRFRDALQSLTTWIAQKRPTHDLVRVGLRALDIAMFLGDLDTYETLLDTLTALAPENVELEAARLFWLNYAEADMTVVAQAHRDWGRLYGACQSKPQKVDLGRGSLGTEKARERPIRLLYIGRYVHGMFFLDVLKAHDPKAVEITVLTDSHGVDWQSLHPGIDVRALSASDPKAVAQEKQIDLAVDLVTNNPLPTGLGAFHAMRQRIAPVQAAWMTGMTTGTDCIDYLVADRSLIPEDKAWIYSEQIAVLPRTYQAWTPPATAPEVVDPPYQENGFITLGSSNRAFKLTPTTLDFWADVMRALPNSRFLIKGRHGEDPVVRSRLEEAFSARGISPDRIGYRGRSDQAGTLAFYNEIDLSLDTYPFGGGITTLETLWMGVPVIGFRGDGFLSRLAYTYLADIDLGHWIPETAEAATNQAIALAKDTDGLHLIRKNLRQKVDAAPFRDFKRITREVEALYLAMLQCGGDPLP